MPEEVAEIEQQMRGRVHTTAIAALEVVPFGMLIADGSAQALAVNQKWMDLSGLGRAESLGAGWLSVFDPEHRARLREDVLQVAQDGEGVTVDFPVTAAPRNRWTRFWISRHQLDGLPLLAIGAADVDDDYSRQANLYHLATHDSLTGLINRSHFMECIEQALRRNQRLARHVGVVYVDLDGFKRVNDRGGHSLGDRVLFAIAARLRHAVRSADMVARIGGDEFAVLCEGLGAADQAEVVARRIATALTESVELDGERWSVAASVGAAVDRGDPDNAEDLVDRADRAMYSIKISRRPGGDEGRGRSHAPASTASAAATMTPPSSERRPMDAWEWVDPNPITESGPGREGERRQQPATAAAGQPEAAEEPPAAAATADPAPAPSMESSPRVTTVAGAEGRTAVTEAEGEAGTAGATGATTTATAATAASAAPSADARNRLAADVVNLRESIESIRRMLDRLMSAESGIIDIREDPGQH